MIRNSVCTLFLIFSTAALHAQTAQTPANQEKLLEFYATQRYTEAAGYLRQMYSPDTENPRELNQLAYTHMMAGNPVAAETYYLKLYQLEPAGLSTLFNLALISRRRGDNNRARSYYQEILKTDSMNFQAYKQLALIISSPADTVKLTYLLKAHALSPADPEVAFDLANGLHLSRKDEDAYQVLQPALAADTNNLILLKAKMPVCIVLKKTDEAILAGTHLMGLGDSSAYVLNHLGKAYLAAGQHLNAIAAFSQMERTGQQNESTLYATALCYRALENYPQAATYVQRTLEASISPAVYAYYEALAEISEKTLEPRLADRYYHKSLDFKPTAEVYYHLALLNELKFGKRAAALRYYRQFLSSGPDAEKYKEVIPYVKKKIRLLSHY